MAQANAELVRMAQANAKSVHGTSLGTKRRMNDGKGMR
jgi:hypothetical protein